MSKTSIRELRIALAQVNFRVGDLTANRKKIEKFIEIAQREQQADLIIFPELSLTGYPPEDLLLNQSFLDDTYKELIGIKPNLNIDILLGLPTMKNGKVYNQAVVIRNGQIIFRYNKQYLPNYGVFDEKRYFTAGDKNNKNNVFECMGVKIGVVICEDIWHSSPSFSAKSSGAQCIVVVNASPYSISAQEQRESVVVERIKEVGLSIVYINTVGGQDELVFDGNSFVINADKNKVVKLPQCEEDLSLAIFRPDKNIFHYGKIAEDKTYEQSIYKCLVMGVRDYVTKNGFKGVVLGLSGGIDSALVLAIATDALGADKVEAIMMPFTYTSAESLEDAKTQAENLTVNYKVIPISKPYHGFMECLANEFQNYEPDTTEENLQARCRGVILMAISNKKGYLVLTTGNKSELAVGYATLYGDMAGGFDVLKDVYKTDVYMLANYRNELSNVIPDRVITRPPSAELAPNQVDLDSLPNYDILDSLLTMYIEQKASAKQIIKAGFEPGLVYRILKQVDRNEHKRRQGPIGIRISNCGLGRDRRLPITSGRSHY